MRGKLTAGVLMALALLIPAAPALAETGSTGLNASCQTVDRTVFKDIRELVTIDLDTASNVEVRILANQILSVAVAESLPVLPDALQKAMDGTADDLRAFLKSDLSKAWTLDLRISVTRTLVEAGPHVKAAAQKTLEDADLDGYLAFLNDGLYAARALDCASPSTSTPSVKPSTTTTGAAIPTSPAGPAASGGAGGGLPVTGADTGTVAGIGGALLLLGGAGYLITRRRRARFVA